VGSAFFWGVKQRMVVIPYRCFGTTYRFHLRGSRNLYPPRALEGACPEA